jgi:hypothetical protein
VPDEHEPTLYVFSGNDLLIAHYGSADLDWQELAERSALDQRRGLVITQVAVLEDLVDEFILYLADPEDVGEYQAKLDTKTIGPRLKRLKRLLSHAGIFDSQAAAVMRHLRRVVDRRNELAHGVIHRDGGWSITSRRSRTVQPITMAGLRGDLHDAIDCFASMLRYAEVFVQIAPEPRNFTGGRYLDAPSP